MEEYLPVSWSIQMVFFSMEDCSFVFSVWFYRVFLLQGGCFSFYASCLGVVFSLYLAVLELLVWCVLSFWVSSARVFISTCFKWSSVVSSSMSQLSFKLCAPLVFSVSISNLGFKGVLPLCVSGVFSQGVVLWMVCYSRVLAPV